MVAGVFILLYQKEEKDDTKHRPRELHQMREMRTGMPFGYIHARKGRRRSGWYVWKAASFAGIAWTYVRPVPCYSEFPPEKTHTIDYSQMPTPEQVMLLIKSRRSNRTLTSRPVPKEMLDKIVEAAHLRQRLQTPKVSFTVVTDPPKSYGR